jgi:hypothetical protein
MKPTQQRITSLLAIIVLLVMLGAMISKCDEKPDTLIAVSTKNIDKQIVDKKAHLEEVKKEIDKANTYVQHLQDEFRGTLYQIDALTKLKAEADTTETKKKK